MKFGMPTLIENKDLEETALLCKELELDFIELDIHDAVGDKNHLTLGIGEINLDERLKIAENHGCRCVIETKTLEALRESVKWINKLK